MHREHVTQLNVDGRVLGRVVERRMVAAHTFSHHSAQYDGRAGIMPVDFEIVG
jgi:hypothetical protein